MYIRVWEYEVVAEHTDTFVAAYGADGDWAQLFQRSRGHVGTELFRGTDDKAHFVTVDRWRDQSTWLAFLEEWGEAYNTLDVAMSRLTTSERGLLEG